MSDWERGYTKGYDAGFRAGTMNAGGWERAAFEFPPGVPKNPAATGGTSRRKRAPSAWNKFVKANSKKPRFIYQSGSKKGRLNLKKLGVAWRRTPAGKKSKRR